jgi:Uma2 family endonuclease
MSSIITPLGSPPSPPPSAESIAVVDAPLYEILDGVRVDLPPLSVYAVVVANRLAFRLNVTAEAQDIGAAYTEALFQLPAPVERKRRPDVAYVSYLRWAKDRPLPLTGNAWEVVPDIATEVTSPTDLADELIAKIHEYFHAGVRLVWVVYPQVAQVYVYESPTRVHILERGQILNAGDVLPGFQLAVADLFPASTGA